MTSEHNDLKELRSAWSTMGRACRSNRQIMTPEISTAEKRPRPSARPLPEVLHCFGIADIRIVHDFFARSAV